MSWSLNRQIIIFLLVTGFFALTAFILWFIYHPRPSCNDSKLNQDELGIDCGGICERVCLNEVSEVVVWWQQALSLGNNQYSVAALIENRNDNFGISRLEYQFKIFGPGQVLLATVPGSTFINPNERVVIYEPNVALGEGEPNRVIFEITDVSWLRQNNPTPIELATLEGRFTNSAPNPQARAVVRNNSLQVYENVDVFIVLSDPDRNVFGVSQTQVRFLGPNESKDVFFTWPNPLDIASTSETIIDIYSRFNTLEEPNF